MFLPSTWLLSEDFLTWLTSTCRLYVLCELWILLSLELHECLLAMQNLTLYLGCCYPSGRAGGTSWLPPAACFAQAVVGLWGVNRVGKSNTQFLLLSDCLAPLSLPFKRITLGERKRCPGRQGHDEQTRLGRRGL